MLSDRIRESQVSVPLGVLVALLSVVALVGAVTLFDERTSSSRSGTGAEGSAQLPDAGGYLMQAPLPDWASRLSNLPVR